MPSVALQDIRRMRWLGGRAIFLCHRRNDCPDMTGRIEDRLVQRFGRRRIIRDVASIPLGVDFRDYVERVMPRCTACLCIIGPNWHCASRETGSCPLDDPADMVRLELSCALKSSARVIPVLVGGARMPAPASLPEPIRMLVNRQGLEVRGDPDFHRDVDRLIADL